MYFYCQNLHPSLFNFNFSDARLRFWSFIESHLANTYKTFNSKLTNCNNFTCECYQQQYCIFWRKIKLAHLCKFWFSWNRNEWNLFSKVKLIQWNVSNCLNPNKMEWASEASSLRFERGRKMGYKIFLPVPVLGSAVIHFVWSLCVRPSVCLDVCVSVRLC